MARFLSLFILVPLLELALLIRVGQWIGLWPTIGIVFVTGIAGAALVRREGVRVLSDMRSDVAGGKVPARSLMDAGALLVGGAFLLTPGVLTDIAGFALLLPPVRALLLKSLRERMERALAQGAVRVHMGGNGWDASAAGANATRSEARGPELRKERDGASPRPGEIIQE